MDDYTGLVMYNSTSTTPIVIVIYIERLGLCVGVEFSGDRKLLLVKILPINPFKNTNPTERLEQI